MLRTVKNTTDTVENNSSRNQSIWIAASLVAAGWVITNIIGFTVRDWFLLGTTGIEFETQLGTALLLAILGLLAGFSLSLALWYSQENFIGIHAVAYTVLVTMLTATIAYVPDGVFILPILFTGLYIGMKWANPDMSIAHVIGSFLIWITVASIMFLVFLMLPQHTENSLLELLRQCVWSGGVGLLGSAFMFWQLSNPEIKITPIMPPRYTTRTQDWVRIYDF